MTTAANPEAVPVSLGSIEPHGAMLSTRLGGQLR